MYTYSYILEPKFLWYSIAAWQSRSGLLAGLVLVAYANYDGVCGGHLALARETRPRLETFLT